MTLFVAGGDADATPVCPADRSGGRCKSDPVPIIRIIWRTQHRDWGREEDAGRWRERGREREYPSSGQNAEVLLWFGVLFTGTRSAHLMYLYNEKVRQSESIHRVPLYDYKCINFSLLLHLGEQDMVLWRGIITWSALSHQWIKNLTSCKSPPSYSWCSFHQTPGEVYSEG